MSGGFQLRPRVQEPYDYVQKIIIIGDSGVGKSNILLRYTQGKFAENYLVTIGMNYAYKIVEVGGVKLKLQIWDTAGQEKYRTITKTYYRNSQGVIVVFGLDSRDSFRSIHGWIEDLVSTSTTAAPVLLIGNKADLNERQVTFEEASQLAQHYGANYAECSAKSGQNIEDSFLALAAAMKIRFIDQPNEKTEDKPKIKLRPITKELREKCCNN